MKVGANPRYEVFYRELKRLTPRFSKWQGVAFRAAPLEFSRLEKLLDGKGSLEAGGRWTMERTSGTSQRKPSGFLSNIARPTAGRFSSVKDFCEAYAVTHETFTRLAGFSPRAVANWAQGQEPSVSTKRRLNELQRLFLALAERVKAEAIAPWLKEPNPAFDGSTPVQVIERGETDRIWRMIYELQSGEPG